MRSEVKTDVLLNGVRFFAQYDWSKQTNAAGVGVKCGAIHTPPHLPGLVGLPHLVEHVLFRECLEYSGEDVDLMTERIGGPDGDINVRIDKASTFYGFDNLLRRDLMLSCLDVIANLLKDRIVNREGIEVEKAAIHNEYFLRGKDDMSSVIYDEMHHVMYDRNPARMRIDCEAEDLKRITPNQIRRFINKHYVPKKMFVIVLGPRFSEVAELVKKYFGEWDSSAEPLFDYDHSDDFPALTTVRSMEIPRLGIGQHYVAIGFPTETYMSKDTEVLDVLARIWSYRLRRRLREQNRDFNKGAYRSPVWVSRSFVHGLMYAWFATVSEEYAKRGEEIILEETRRFKQDLVSDRELDTMKECLEDAYLYAFRCAPGILSEMIINAVCNGDEELTNLHSYRDRLHRVTRKKLRNVANKYFTDNYARVLIKPA